MNARIKIIASQVPKCQTLCDVGCDHGYVAYLAKTQDICKNVILTDISSSSLKKAEKLFLQNGIEFTSYVTFGMDNVKEHIDTALICGMGGHEIADIIKKRKVQNLVLQPMLDVRMLRVFLSENGYKIEKDFIFYCGEKYYNLIVASVGDCCLTREQVLFGNNTKNITDDFLKYIDYRKHIIKKILSHSLSQDKQQQLLEELSIIGEIQRHVDK